MPINWPVNALTTSTMCVYRQLIGATPGGHEWSIQASSTSTTQTGVLKSAETGTARRHSFAESGAWRQQGS